MTELFLLVRLDATFFMVEVIRFFQVVHYSPFEEVNATGFPAYSRTHSRLPVPLSPPADAPEAAIALVAIRPAGVSAALAWTGLVLLALA